MYWDEEGLPIYDDIKHVRKLNKYYEKKEDQEQKQALQISILSKDIPLGLVKIGRNRNLEFQEHKLFDDYMQIFIPKSYQSADKQVRQDKNTGEELSIYSFYNASLIEVVTIKETKDEILNRKVATRMYLDRILENIELLENESLMNPVTWEMPGAGRYNGHWFSYAEGEHIYNNKDEYLFLFVTSFNGKAIVGEFCCQKENSKVMSKIFHGMMSCIRFMKEE